MIVSFNEIAAMGKRAARGAGMSWGLAEEAGRSARWLAEYGLPGPELLANLLDDQDGIDRRTLSPDATEDTWSAPSGRLCPIVTGAALCDRAHLIATGKGIELGTTAQPALLAAYVADSAGLTGSTIELAWDQVVMTFGPEGATLQGTDVAFAAASVDSVHCRRTDALGEVTKPTPGGWNVDPDRWSRLGKLAHRTFAPSTEESRLAGAGAGLIDD